MQKKAKILFMFQHAVHWINASQLFDTMLNSSEFEPVVLLVPTIPERNQFKDIAEEKNIFPQKNVLDDKKIYYKYLEDISIKDFDAAIYLGPYDETRPEEYRSYNLYKQGLKIFYIPYALDIGGGAVNTANQYMLDIHRIASGIFVRSNLNKKNYTLYCPSGDKHVYVTGLPVFDALYSINKNRISAATNMLYEKIGDRFPIVWNSHYSFDGNIWSTFDIMAESFFNLARANQALALIWRPHPWTFNKLHNYGFLTNETEKQFIAKLENYGVIVDTSPDYIESFLCAKAIMTDASSLLLSSLAFNKPVLYLKNTKGRGLEPEGEQLSTSIAVAETPNEAVQFIQNVFDGNDPKKALRLIAQKKHLFGLDGQISNRVANIIKRLI